MFSEFTLQACVDLKRRGEGCRGQNNQINKQENRLFTKLRYESSKKLLPWSPNLGKHMVKYCGVKISFQKIVTCTVEKRTF